MQLHERYLFAARVVAAHAEARRDEKKSRECSYLVSLHEPPPFHALICRAYGAASFRH